VAGEILEPQGSPLCRRHLEAFLVGAMEKVGKSLPNSFSSLELSPLDVMIQS
jgi:hypothetical protein